ncbi:hypothetical protein [Sporolactobacillus shoreicorticis]|uniref:Uncharacterized protein n=1 Tax=Sporolactobacillus shoreicorticis TaxID=1923877 RepID=A0ABW5S4U4_9BACL|nr:hypothetical protein [Sporolactobacillus shoreicorticis]
MRDVEPFYGETDDSDDFMLLIYGYYDVQLRNMAMVTISENGQLD